MPGNVSLGCLLGQLNHAMSFDVASASWATDVGSWVRDLDAASTYFDSTATHSSAQGMRVDVFSEFAGLRRVALYHGVANDYLARRFTNVTTHDLWCSAWARIGTASFSGAVRFGILTTSSAAAPIPFAATLQYIEHRTIASSLDTPALLPHTVFSLSPSVGSFSLYADDVITRVDPITLFPDWTLEQSRALIRAGHDATGGYNRETIWSSFGTWKLPLRFLSDSHAALINWWWKNSFTLALTLDTSDADTTAIVRIVNDQQPIGARSRPYDNLWNGTLMLEAIDKGSLVY